jgi:glycerol-3-phosphate O-acyltransferase
MGTDITIRHDVFVHHDDAKLDEILHLLRVVIRKEDNMSKELDDLTVQVKANIDAEASAVTLIQGIAAQLLAAAQDPAKIVALSSTLKTSADALAAAVVANTPVVPAP